MCSTRLICRSLNGRVAWDSVTPDQLHDVIRGAAKELDTREEDVPTNGVLQRYLQFKETVRALSPFSIDLRDYSRMRSMTRSCARRLIYPKASISRRERPDRENPWAASLRGIRAHQDCCSDDAGARFGSINVMRISVVGQNQTAAARGTASQRHAPPYEVILSVEYARTTG